MQSCSRPVCPCLDKGRRRGEGKRVVMYIFWMPFTFLFISYLPVLFDFMLFILGHFGLIFHSKETLIHASCFHLTLIVSLHYHISFWMPWHPRRILINHSPGIRTYTICPDRILDAKRQRASEPHLPLSGQRLLVSVPDVRLLCGRTLTGSTDKPVFTSAAELHRNESPTHVPFYDAWVQVLRSPSSPLIMDVPYWYGVV